MNNVIKILSNNKDYRMVVIDTKKIIERELAEFKGSPLVRNVMKRFITNCVLLSGIHDFKQKISVSLRLSANMSFYCVIADRSIYSEYNEAGCDNEADLFDCQSILAVTTGDWQTGIYTGTVKAQMDDMDMIFSHYMMQSEQIYGRFMTGKKNIHRGCVYQILPFADETNIQKEDQKLSYLLEELECADWLDVPKIYDPVGTVVFETKIE